MALVARYDEGNFRRQLDAALEQVKKVLDASRNPRHPSAVSHEYDDKYYLAEVATRTAAAAQLNALASFDPAWERHLQHMQEWAKTRVVTLAFSSVTKCKFVRTTTRKVDSAVEHVTQSTVFGTTKSKTVTTVIEHFWGLDIDWTLIAYPGNDPQAESLTLISAKGKHEIKTTGPEPVAPKPEQHAHKPMEVNVSWLLKHSIQDFAIGRAEKTCHTPRRNPDIESALQFFQRYSMWAEGVRNWLHSSCFGEQAGHAYDLGCVSSDGVFAPVLPVFAFDDSSGAAAAAAAGSGAVSVRTSPGDCDRFLEEQRRTLATRREAIARVLPAAESGELITVVGAGLSIALQHAALLAQHHAWAVQSIEDMLCKQLIAAIGKELGPADFAEYMDFHNRRLFRPEYRPRGFCYAVRRPDHYPEGTVSLESAESAGSGDATPLRTFVVHRRASEPMKFPLSAASELSFYGDRFLHACMLHRFSGQPQAALRLCARARQFSSYILLVGKIAAADAFDPQAALIVQNKDDLTLPLLLETIPTPKEFRDAIESLSPEQQRFAKAFRAMQLASTVFGVLIIQIKPQMERLLNLPADSLTKEVELTQELMEMFIKYQFPSDLMSYDGDSEAPAGAKVARVKEHTAALRGMIRAAREKELAEQAELEQKRLMEREVRERELQMLAGFHDEIHCVAEKMAEARPQRAVPKGRSFFGAAKSAPARRSQECAAAPVTLTASCSAAAAPPPPPPPPGAPKMPSAPAGGKGQQQQAPPTQTPQSDKVRVEVRQQDGGGGGGGSAAASEVGTVDYTEIPTALDQRFDKLDEDAAVRPTIIKIGDGWKKKSQAGLISDMKETTLGQAQQRTERDRAFDLLDALSRSGSLPVESASLHVVLAATHCFDETLLNTVIRKNVNPIEKAERSCLIMTSTINDKPAAELIEEQHVARVQEHSRLLFAGPA
eukprot:TRINITY_DN682_c0_g1_i6.p1 TRINITY_DN682_c0_g1~~TRINITY_DN682_c0_g1_i6.p1  ORF type:complete len:982 (+),score=408.29 TRINITY_DN682_c0_g1_i6:116-2947(+)